MSVRPPPGWLRITADNPLDNRVVKTAIIDADGMRNEQTLKRSKRLWWFPDGSMYVYYTPTHWKP